jgi:hypothetical protein
VVINKEKVNQNDKRIYFIAYQDTIEEAAKNLTGNEFKLYIYFLSNQDAYEDLFSPSFFGNSYGTSADTARKLFQKLIEKGYLQKTEEHTCEFYDKPRKKLKVKVPRRLVVDDDGVAYELTYEELCEALKAYSKETIDYYWNKSEEV